MSVAGGGGGRGRERGGSDVDIGLLDSRPIDGESLFDMADRIGAEIGLPPDLVDLHEAPQPIAGSVLRGRRLFGSNACFAELCARHWIEREDYGRIRDREITRKVREWIR